MLGEVPAERSEAAAASHAARQWHAVHGRERPAIDARSAGGGGEDAAGTLGTAETDLAGGFWALDMVEFLESVILSDDFCDGNYVDIYSIS